MRLTSCATKPESNCNSNCSNRRRPIAVNGGAFSQSPVCGAMAAFSLALSADLSHLVCDGIQSGVSWRVASCLKIPVGALSNRYVIGPLHLKIQVGTLCNRCIPGTLHMPDSIGRFRVRHECDYCFLDLCDVMFSGRIAFSSKSVAADNK